LKMPCSTDVKNGYQHELCKKPSKKPTIFMV
jgi:hypothetical protein